MEDQTNQRNFSTVLVQDPRLLVTDRIKYGVIQGGSSCTTTPFNAITQSSSQIVFNVQCPSESTLIDRHILLQSTVTLAFSATITPTELQKVPQASRPDMSVFSYAQKDALQVFPLQSLFSTMSSTINNSVVTINLNDVLQAILLMNETNELYEYNGTTNTLPDDTYYNYSDAILANSNPLGGLSNTDNDMSCIPRGCLPVSIFNIAHSWTAGGGTNGAAAGNNTGSFLVGAAGCADPNQINTWTWNLTFKVVEPLLMSPWLFGNPKICPAIYGIQNLNFQFNIGNTNRVFSSASPYITNISLAAQDPFQNTCLYLNFITCQSTQLLQSKNVVPYYELPRYIMSPSQNQILAATPAYTAPNNTTVASTTSTVTTVAGIPIAPSTYTSNNIQLNQIPDKVIIFARLPLANQTCQNSSSFACISNISINFNNNAGLLSSVPQYTLYQMSKKNGSTQTWSQFCGFQSSYLSTNNGGYTIIPTTGSLLVLEFGTYIPLPGSYYAPGSLGSFNFQFTIQLYNQSTTAYTPDIVLVTLNSGLFVSDRGSSSIYTGILNREDVLSTSEQTPYTKADVDRLIGSGFHSHLKSNLAYGLHNHFSRMPQYMKGHGIGGENLSGGDVSGIANSGGKVHHKKLLKHIRK